jgi:hypothetical protein
MRASKAAKAAKTATAPTGGDHHHLHVLAVVARHLGPPEEPLVLDTIGRVVVPVEAILLGSRDRDAPVVMAPDLDRQNQAHLALGLLAAIFRVFFHPRGRGWQSARFLWPCFFRWVLNRRDLVGVEGDRSLAVLGGRGVLLGLDEVGVGQEPHQLDGVRVGGAVLVLAGDLEPRGQVVQRVLGRGDGAVFLGGWRGPRLWPTPAPSPRAARPPRPGGPPRRGPGAPARVRGSVERGTEPRAT